MSELNPEGQLINTISYGGSSSDEITSMVFKDDILYMIGITQSQNYPTTDNTTYSGEIDGFLMNNMVSDLTTTEESNAQLSLIGLILLVPIIRRKFTYL